MVKEAEALGLLYALNYWGTRLGFEKVIFVTDAQVVRDAIYSHCVDLSEFGCIVQQCCEILILKKDFSVHFVRRQADVVVHALAREARPQAHPIVFTEIPNCISGLLSPVCFDLNH
ncbi:hypothetical protein PTKIN_Ptkin09bG0197400 [Pterospermum kingtungense]